MRTARRRTVEAGLTITSLMDAMTIILCFLLKSYEADDVTVAASDELHLPASTALTRVRRAVQVVITRSGIVVDGEWVADVLDGGGESATVRIDPVLLDGELIRPLDERLRGLRDDAAAIEALVGDGQADFEGEVLLQVDRDLPFRVVRKAMYTAGQAGFGKVRFVVIAS